MPGKKLGFFENFMLSGVAAAVSKTAAAPIERVKLLVQNQDEMIKQGRLKEPYKGVGDCVMRVMKTEGILPFWRGNYAFLVTFYGKNLKVDGSCLRHFDHFPKWPRRFLLEMFSEVSNEFEEIFFSFFFFNCIFGIFDIRRD